jgi:putative phage-type endonuclease
MPAICGVSPYVTALDIYLSKVNPAPEREQLTYSDPRRVGQLIEPTIARLYCERTGKTLVKADTQNTHPTLSWMNASLDYVHADDGEPVDCKNTSRIDAWGEDGTDQVPYHIAIQMHHQMEVAEKDRAHVAAFFFGNTLKVYTINRDEELAASLIEIGNDFWRMVEERTPPEPDWSHKATPNVIKKLYDKVESRTVYLGETEQVWIKRYFSLQDEIKRLGEEADELKARLLAAMGNAELAILPDGHRITRKQADRAEKVVKAYSFIDTRLYRPTKKSAQGYVEQEYDSAADEAKATIQWLGRIAEHEALKKPKQKGK